MYVCIYIYIYTYKYIHMHIYIGTPSSPEGGGQARGAGSCKKTAETQGAKKIKVTKDLKIKHLEEASAITSSPAPKASRGRTNK